MSNFPNTSADFREFFHTMRNQIHSKIRSLIEKFGGKVCFRIYHDNGIIDLHYTFYKTYDNGFGRAMFLDTAEITPEGDIDISLYDSEGRDKSVWRLEDITVTDALHILEELGQIAEFHAEHPDYGYFDNAVAD